MNNISIVGRLTKDIELQTTSNGVVLARFNVAVTSEFKDENGERKADFFPCIAWRDAAENIAKYFKKGSPIGVFGSMNNRAYVSNGENKSIWELNVKGFSFVGSTDPTDAPSDGKNKKTNKKATQQKFEEIENDGNLPF